MSWWINPELHDREKFTAALSEADRVREQRELQKDAGAWGGSHRWRPTRRQQQKRDDA